MPVENPNGIIANLNPIWPLDDDVKSEGDDTLRMLKKLLQEAFPGVSGNGFEKVITATADEINYLQGVTSNIQQQINGLQFPIGTRMVFVQASVPVGWTIDATMNDRVIRIMSNSGGIAGGSWSITGLTVDAHTHSVSIESGTSIDDSKGDPGSGDLYSHATHTHNVIGTTGNSSASGVISDGTWRPAYVDAVIGVRT